MRERMITIDALTKEFGKYGNFSTAMVTTCLRTLDVFAYESHKSNVTWLLLCTFGMI